DDLVTGVQTCALPILPRPRTEMSTYAPRITTILINPDKIRDIIGPGGKMIRKITEETGAQIDVEDDGRVFIAAVDQEGGQKAIESGRASCREGGRTAG